MPTPFGPRSTLITRVALAGVLLALVAVPVGAMILVRTPLATGEHDAPVQPVPFSHPLHVTGFEIDCRYCHYAVERAPTAGMPATTTCIPCHSDEWLATAWFAPVRASHERGLPIPWKRVNGLPDHVQFDHSIHVTRGVGCETCHGRVDRMNRVAQAAPLTMSWCLDCHREPARYLRPLDEVTTMGYAPTRPQAEVGPELQAAYGVREITNCTACHR